MKKTILLILLVTTCQLVYCQISIGQYYSNPVTPEESSLSTTERRKFIKKLKTKISIAEDYLIGAKKLEGYYYQLYRNINYNDIKYYHTLTEEINKAESIQDYPYFTIYGYGKQLQVKGVYKCSRSCSEYYVSNAKFGEKDTYDLIRYFVNENYESYYSFSYVFKYHDNSKLYMDLFEKWQNRYSELAKPIVEARKAKQDSIHNAEKSMIVVRRKELAVESLARYRSNENITTFYGMDLNYANNRVQTFLYDAMKMRASEELKYNINDDVGYIEEHYTKQILINKDVQNFKIRYYVHGVGHNFIIDRCEISGYSEYVVDFYVRFWDTTMSFEEARKEEIVVNHFLDDRISLSTNHGNEECKIIITQN